MNRTKAAITDAFLQLLEEKPYKKITVQNIVELCQINRNTFYYHFRDIPDLLEQTIKNHADFIIKNYSSFGTPLDCILPLLKYSTEHKKSVLHIYSSVHREAFLDNLERIVLYVVNEYVNTVTIGLSLSAEDKNLLIRLYKCVLVGIMIDWLEEGMNYDLPKAFTRICALFSGTGKQAFLKSSE